MLNCLMHGFLAQSLGEDGWYAQGLRPSAQSKPTMGGCVMNARYRKQKLLNSQVGTEMPLCDCPVRKLCWSNALQISLHSAERGFYSAGPEVPSAAFVCSHGGPSGRKEKLVILWLIGRLSRANKDICFLAEVLTNPNLSCSILSFFHFLWYP